MDSALPCEFRRNLGFILDITIACAYNCTPASGLVLIRLEHSHTDGISGLPDSGIAASQGAPAAVVALLQHWQQNNVPLTTARRLWLDSLGRGHTEICNFRCGGWGGQQEMWAMMSGEDILSVDVKC